MIKSFLLNPFILCIHQATVTLAHSVKMSGGRTCLSVSSPSLLMNAGASAKSLNSKDLLDPVIPFLYTSEQRCSWW